MYEKPIISMEADITAERKMELTSFQDMISMQLGEGEVKINTAVY